MDPLVTQSPLLFQEQFRNEQTCKQKEEATPHPALALPHPAPRYWSPLAWHCDNPSWGSTPTRVCVCACVCTSGQGTPSPQHSPQSLGGDAGSGTDAMLLHRHLTAEQVISRLLQSVAALTPKVLLDRSACPCARSLGCTGNCLHMQHRHFCQESGNAAVSIPYPAGNGKTPLNLLAGKLFFVVVQKHHFQRTSALVSIASVQCIAGEKAKQSTSTGLQCEQGGGSAIPDPLPTL